MSIGPELRKLKRRERRKLFLVSIETFLDSLFGSSGFPVRVLPKAENLRASRQRVTGVHGCKKPAVCVTQIGDRVERYLGNAFPKNQMED